MNVVLLLLLFGLWSVSLWLYFNPARFPREKYLCICAVTQLAMAAIGLELANRSPGIFLLTVMSVFWFINGLGFLFSALMERRKAKQKKKITR